MICTDPFLRSVQRAPFLFDIGGGLTPISIRDQMVRGQLLGDRAAREFLSIANSRLNWQLLEYPVLVIGAGAAGATAAVSLLDAGFRRVVLIERSARPFMRQRGCHSRRISPTLYGWPAANWTVNTYPDPAHPPLAPFPWSFDSADGLAIHWEKRLKDWIRVYRGALDVRPRTTSLALAWRPAPPVGGVVRSGHWESVWRLGPPPVVERFALVVLAPGFGEETSEAKTSYGGLVRTKEFWDDDPFATLRTGVREWNDPSRPLVPARVAISGSGDGALQDYLRICLGTNDLSSVLTSLALPDGFLKQVFDLEEAYTRGWQWSTKPLDPAAMEAHHNNLASLVDELLRSSVGTAISSTLAKLLHGFPGHKDFLRLFHSGTGFTAFYSLNRVLTQLVARSLRETYGIETMFPDYRLKFADPVPPVIPAARGVGVEHRLTFDTPGAGGFSTDCNVLIVRHGVHATAGSVPVVNYRPDERPNPRQILPYRLPVV